MLRNPWQLLQTTLDGSLHPGGDQATEALLDRAEVDAGSRLLDIGCGAGTALEIANKRGAKTVGLDRHPTGSRMVRADMRELPFRAHRFDAVLGECVLCLSPDFGGTLEEIGRVLKPEGRLALSDVTVEGTPPELPPPIDELLCVEGPRSSNHIRREIERAGFEIDNVHTHQDDLLAMRDQLRDAVDIGRLVSVLGERGADLREGVRDLESAVESGDIGYISIVATHH